MDVPDRPATAFFGAKLTYREIKNRADRLATAFDALRHRQGRSRRHHAAELPAVSDRGVRHPAARRNRREHEPDLHRPRAAGVAHDSGMRLLVTLDVLAPLALGVPERTALEHIIVTSLAEHRPRVARRRRSTARGVFGSSGDVPRAAPVRVPIDADDVAVLQYTGGTTGTPKGAMLTHANIFANVVQTEACMYRTRERGAARYLMVIPYFHIYGFTVGMMSGTWVGALQILIPKYDVEQVLNALRDHRPTYFPAVPTIFVSLLTHPRVKECGLDQVRTFNSGARPALSK